MQKNGNQKQGTEERDTEKDIHAEQPHSRPKMEHSELEPA